MPVRLFLLLLALAVTLPLAACTTDTDDDDDATPPGMDDDDDDATPAPDPTMDVDPTALSGGEMVAASVTISDMNLNQGVGTCATSSSEILVWEVLNETDDGFDMLTMPGIYADGTQTWCLTNGVDEVSVDFTVAPYASGLAPLTLGAPEAIDLADDGAFAVWTMELGEDATVYARVGTPGADLDPNLMILGEDGHTFIAAAGRPLAGGDRSPDVVVAQLDAGNYIVRAGQNDLSGGVDATGSVEVIAPVMPALVEVPEVEPNDLNGEYHDLGELGLGDWLLSGTAETAGHNSANDLGGDLDYFQFTLADEATFDLELLWEAEGQDFDAILFDNSDGGGADGTFNSSDPQLGSGLSSFGQPEAATVVIRPGSYVFGIGNWEGDDGVPWMLSMKVRPHAWPTS